jgi:hypothetical protein
MNDGFLDEYEGLAEEIAVKARGADIVLGDKIDALKALTPFYVHKMKNMKPVSDTDALNFDTFTSTIHASENGREN